MDDRTRMMIEYVVRLDLHVSSALRGCKYLEDAVAVTMENPDMKIQQVCEIVGEKWGIAGLHVNRMIYHTIDRTYKKNKLCMVWENDKKPSLKKLIEVIIEKVNERLQGEESETV